MQCVFEILRFRFLEMMLGVFTYRVCLVRWYASRRSWLCKTNHQPLWDRLMTSPAWERSLTGQLAPREVRDRFGDCFCDSSAPLLDLDVPFGLAANCSPARITLIVQARNLLSL
jgi:hypothetical protein